MLLHDQEWVTDHMTRIAHFQNRNTLVICIWMEPELHAPLRLRRSYAPGPPEYSKNPDIIIESVDSNVGIARTRSIWQYIKISPNLKNGELISFYDNILFIFECFHDQQDSQWREKASQKYPTKQQQKRPNCFSSSSSSSFFLSFFLRTG